MNFPQSGGCQCGAIRYEITGSPVAVYACHCTECQKQSGSAFAMGAVIPQEHFRITEGKPKKFAREISPSKTWNAGFALTAGRGSITFRAVRLIQTETSSRGRWMIDHGWSRRLIFGLAAHSSGWSSPKA
jgi:hypothetical protein